MNEIMLQLGSYQFGVTTAAYQTLKRTHEYNWAEQKRFGQLAALQFTGPGNATVTLEGCVYAEHNGGTGQLDDMRALADEGQPQTLVSGLGDIMGEWVIESIQEDASIFAQRGVARKQEFTLQIKQYST
jgi:phage tail protein